jgi:hypothetical protein
MNAARGWHSMCVANENLYVFGGCYLANTTISNIGGNLKTKKLTVFIGYIPNFFSKYPRTCVALSKKNQDYVRLFY